MNATAIVLAAHGRNCGLFHEKELLLRGVIRSMINAIDAKDSYTCGHSDRVAEYARLIARELSLDLNQCEQIYMTGLLHDVGKIGVPDEVLNKPGQLTDSEFELIKQHPVIGFEILKHLENLDYVLPGVLHHHEAIDGSGYPHGLQGSEIPLEARILAVADAYDAMTSDRPYRRGMPGEKAEAILRNGAGRQWDPDCVDAFFRTTISVRLIASQRSSPFSPVSTTSPKEMPSTRLESPVTARSC
jgi:HD-GYP domain-containing protein (c-di-GMP phosphodiesterase class II)